jgi:uncharacterized metal-binding protein YceD (DUF177 family)
LVVPAEFSRPLSLDGLPPQGVCVQLDAGPEERSALAARFELVAIESLAGELHVAPVQDAASFLVTGRLSADVVQSCVVTLEPVPGRIEVAFDRLFSRAIPAEAAGEVEIDAEALTPEPLIGDRLDLGEILAEELALALEPYPRAPDAGEHLDRIARNPRSGRPSAFAALAGLRRH